LKGGQEGRREWNLGKGNGERGGGVLPTSFSRELGVFKRAGLNGVEAASARGGKKRFDHGKARVTPSWPGDHLIKRGVP